MEKLKIRLYGDPILRKRSEEVTLFDASLSSFVKDMIDVMFRYDGLGLAAPQIGVSKRIAVVLKDKEPVVLINPVLLKVSDDLQEANEGCLSFPDIYEAIKRPVWVKVKAFDTEGREFEVSGEGLTARAILHELDHLDGKLLIDYLSPAKKALVKSKMRKLWKK